MQQNESFLKKDSSGLKEKSSLKGASVVTENWIPLKDVMAFFDYKPTQMANLQKQEELIVAKVGKRKFILRESIERLLEKNIIASARQNVNRMDFQ